jgi:hypothetical protein
MLPPPKAVAESSENNVSPRSGFPPGAREVLKLNYKNAEQATADSLKQDAHPGNGLQRLATDTELGLSRRKGKRRLFDQGPFTTRDDLNEDVLGDPLASLSLEEPSAVVASIGTEPPRIDADQSSLQPLEYGERNEQRGGRSWDAILQRARGDEQPQPVFPSNAVLSNRRDIFNKHARGFSEQEADREVAKFTEEEQNRERALKYYPLSVQNVLRQKPTAEWKSTLEALSSLSRTDVLHGVVGTSTAAQRQGIHLDPTDLDPISFKACCRCGSGSLHSERGMFCRCGHACGDCEQCKASMPRFPADPVMGDWGLSFMRLLQL